MISISLSSEIEELKGNPSESSVLLGRAARPPFKKDSALWKPSNFY